MTPVTELLDRQRFEIKLGDYGVGTAQALNDQNILARTQDYRRQTGSRMMPLGKSDIREKVPAADYHASRKVDGEFAVLVLRDGELFSINPGGTVRIGLPWQAEAILALKKAGIQEAMIAGELYVHNTERRPRVHDVATVARQPQSLDDIGKLRFAVFDVISIDSQPPSDSYGAVQNQASSHARRSRDRIYRIGRRPSGNDARFAARRDAIRRDDAHSLSRWRRL
jgi:hypothetical protein